MAKVCLSILYYKDFLQDAASKGGTSKEYPPIRVEVLQHINDRHFANNKELVTIIQPIADLIGELEKSKTNIAHIVVQFIKLHKYYIGLAQCVLHQNPFVEEALHLLSKRYKQYFICEIYLLPCF